MGYNAGAIALACLVVLAILLAWWRASPRTGTSGRTADGFYTEHGQEEPTRAYTPYTGTPPYGPWGSLPWAEASLSPRPRCYGCWPDFDSLHQPVCALCGGARSYHDSVQSERPHSFVASEPRALKPHEAGPHWEGGVPVLN